MAVTIQAIAQGSHAMRHGIQSGEKLVSINGHTVMDTGLPVLPDGKGAGACFGGCNGQAKKAAPEKAHI